MAKHEDMVSCETPTPGKKATRIPRWKYETIRAAIRRLVPRNSQGIAFRLLPDLVERALTEEERKRIGSVAWYTVTVKLHLEVAGEIERIASAKPQRIRRVR